MSQSNPALRITLSRDSSLSPICIFLDSRASTSTIPPTQKPKPLTIDTANHSTMVSSKILSPAFRSSPLNPASSPSSADRPAYLSRRSPTFPASRPLRPFPSIAQSLVSPKSPELFVRHEPLSPKREDGNAAVTGTRSPKSPKTIEISSKWKGGFFVLGMTQQEFSRRD